MSGRHKVDSISAAEGWVVTLLRRIMNSNKITKMTADKVKILNEARIPVISHRKTIRGTFLTFLSKNKSDYNYRNEI